MNRRAFGLAAAGLALSAGRAAAQEAVTIGVSLASDTNPFYIAMRRGMDERARELGWRLRFVTANEDVVAQNNGVLDLIAQRVNGILISPIDAVATRAAYEAAARANIPIISVARHADSPHQTLYVAMDEVQIGRDVANWVIRAMGGPGQVAMIAGPQGAATFRNLAAGFSEVITRAPGVQVVARRDVALTRDEGLRVAQDLLVAHPNLRAIYGGNDDIALGAAQAVAQSGRAGQVIVTGLNGIPPALAAVRRGDVSLTVELNPATWGRLGIDTMARWLRGERGFDRVNVGHVLVDRSNVPPAR
ncbi:substrate-binding domain-containing protein [Falsiroseomonas oryzae]|uniref:substrate-binding domain-containing protein n=1 Tax=Falsiroseomonas oryzae TaxID=2766473 RepID=UPI0022EA3F94|nr:substrate-binding domain-containing protein [Roseomonas sp. MO-31]